MIRDFLDTIGSDLHAIYCKMAIYLIFNDTICGKKSMVWPQ